MSNTGGNSRLDPAGHFSYREHPERFNALLAGFVANASA